MDATQARPPAAANGARGPRACVLKADGTNCEAETAHALSLAGARAEIVPMNALRARDARLDAFDLLVVPGGFSYGDDVSSGKILAVELMTFLGDEVASFAAGGRPILGICNGFQVLVRTGLLPFGTLGAPRATLTDNRTGRYECRWVDVAPEGTVGVAPALPARLSLPVAHAEGRFYADDDTLAEIEDAGLVALRYVDATGAPALDHPHNPAGACHAIAGVHDATGRILGLMPHPERYVARHHHPDWRRLDGRAPDGLAFLQAFVALA